VLRVRCGELPADPEQLGRTIRALLREARLAGAVPLLEDLDQLAPDPDLERPDRARFIAGLLSAHDGTLLATAGRSDSRPIRLGRGLVIVDVPPPTESERVELWTRALGGGGELACLAAARYPLTPGVIGQAADSALAAARARGGAVEPGDLHLGVRSSLDAKLSTLGMRITWRQRWDDLVLPDDALAEVQEFIARVRYKRHVYEEWGFGRKVAKGLGLSALFSGPPGTGKTMVAGLIADELGLDLYQVDLSRVVSKYVGETEKNLAQLFDAAESGHAILLFDEADSLFARRTEVKSSVDRYANLEVNYLLQRMEQFAGLTILTTNNDTAIDEAFRRRLSFRVEFPMPEREERARLWQAMLPEQAALAANVDWGRLADRFVMSGGYIRNAVLRAAFLAAEQGSAISMHHLTRAAHLEYTAMGKVMSSWPA
jgi:SpoVK/Ycf46/Vps4 family AAA+-type ATPase